MGGSGGAALATMASSPSARADWRVLLLKMNYARSFVRSGCLLLGYPADTNYLLRTFYAYRYV